MITETEAAACWHDKRVCMNSVDPGYMSAAPGFGMNIPLGWEDGAGRVLWPVAVGWGKEVVRNSAGGRAVWGKFLKHYRPSQWGGEAFWEHTQTLGAPYEAYSLGCLLLRWLICCRIASWKKGVIEVVTRYVATYQNRRKLPTFTKIPSELIYVHLVSYILSPALASSPSSSLP
jgi:hypothetical protein